MKKIIAAGAFGLAMGVSGMAFAEPVKIGMITTLSGGGAGLGIDVPLERVALTAEIGAVAMATDYGAGAFNFPTLHVPLTVGVRF